MAASADTLPGGSASPSSAPSAPGASAPAAGVGSPAPIVIAPAPATGVKPPTLTERERFAEQNSLVGDGRKLAVPVPGVEKAQKKLGTMAQCQGPQAQQHYATLSGKARTDFARVCARYGITLSP